MNYILFGYSIFITFILIYISKDITFFGRGFQPNKDGKLTLTDQEKMILGTSKLKLFFWPSEIHSIENSRGQLREIWVFFINILSKCLKSRDEFLNVLLSLISNLGCIILIYFILDIYFSSNISFFGAALYATSIWPYQIAFFFGHILLAQFFFFLSIFTLANIDIYPEYAYLLTFISGFLLVICFSSSSASRKYPPLIFIFFIFTIFEDIDFSINYNRSIIFIILLLVTIIVFQIIKNKFYNFIKKKIEQNVSKEKVEFYFEEFQKKLFKFGYFPLLTILIFFCYNQNLGIFFTFGIFSLGIIFASLLILYPNFIRGIGRYFVFLEIGNWANHFRAYPKNHFKHDTSGNFIAPPTYYLNFLPRFCPLVSLLYVLSLFFVLSADFFLIEEKILYIFISLVPLLVIELSKAMRVAKSYLPILVGFIFLITIAAAKLEKIYSNDVLFLIMGVLIFLNFFHKIFFLIKDVIPTRLGPSNLGKFLIKNKIYKIGTYNNPYNDEIVGPINQKFSNKIKFKFYESLDYCKDCDYFLVPQRSAKSFSMESQQFAIKNGDFKMDKKLNEIEKNNILNDIIVKRFKTLGTSRFYVGESEISGYREFCLKDITEADRKLTYALILDLRKLNDK
jgi:hypothetical protein